MSIATQIETLKRANATAKAPNAAKRGQLCLVKKLRSYTMARTFERREYAGFQAGIVTSVSRDGTVLRVRVPSVIESVNTILRLDRRDWIECLVDTRGAVGDPASVVAALGSREFDTIGEAQAAIKAAAGLA